MTYYKLLIDISDVPKDVQQLYINNIESINKNLNRYNDSGFDLFCVEDRKIDCKSISNKINLNVKCSMIDPQGYPVGFFLCPRSSLGSNTPLRLSNNLGIIDSGYRRHLMAVVDNIDYKDYIIQKNQRCFQILAPTLLAIQIEIVNSLDSTKRGINGFGSSG